MASNSVANRTISAKCQTRRSPASSAHATFRAAYSAWRKSQGLHAVKDAPERLTRSGRNGSWHPPVNRSWNDCIWICNSGGLPQLCNWFRFPSSRTERRPLELLASAERRANASAAVPVLRVAA
jgi:hypothetical protein